MRLQLAKTLDGIKKFGPIYDLGTGVPEKVEEYVNDKVDAWFIENLMDKVNTLCDTLLDDGDFDFVGADKCKALIKMLEDIPTDSLSQEIIDMLNVLSDYSKRAIEYKTGIEIEL